MNGIQNAVIDSVTLRIERGFILDSWVHVAFGGGSGQGFGGFALYLGKTATHHSLLSEAGHWIYRVMEIAGVEDWARLNGKAIRVQSEDGLIVAIGHIVKDDWFYPKIDFDAAKAVRP